MAIVGPNGAGKTTLLSAVAGLLPIAGGEIRLGDRLVDDGTPATLVPPEQRGVGYVFQDHLLFPHLSALDNVAFGLRVRGSSRPAARAAAQQWLDRFGIGAEALRRPGALSGGQAQRVALARALAFAPEVLLLDEPLAAIDASARLLLRRELRQHLAGFAGVRLVVAHDVIDALALADRVAVMENGRVVQIDSVAAICSRPRSRYVADLIGVNLLRGRIDAGQLRLHDGGSLVVPTALQGEVLATVHPRAIAMFRVRPDGTPRNVWQAPIRSLEPAGDRVRVQLGGVTPLVAEVTPAAVADLGLGAGGEVWVALKATEIGVYPA